MRTIKRAFAITLIATMLCSFFVFPTVAVSNNYTLSNTDFSQMSQLTADYTVSGSAVLEKALVMEHGSGTGNSGGASWRAFTIGTAEDGPQVGDIIHAKVTMYISEDAVLAAGIPIVKVAAFGPGGANGRDLLHLDNNTLASVPRGQLVTVCDIAAAEFAGVITQHWYGTVHEGTEGGFVQVELHNDMSAGTVEIVGIELWATREGAEGAYSAVYDIGDFTAWDKAPNAGTAPYVQQSLRLDAGASISRSIPVTGEAGQPAAGDKVSGTVMAYGKDATVKLNVADSVNTLTEAQQATGGTWQKYTLAQEGAAIGAEERTITMTLSNTGTQALRLRNFTLAGEKSMDYTGDGKWDAADLAAMEEALAHGSTDPKYDLDGDGEFTSKDISYLRKFYLEYANEFYLNLEHFDFLSEEIEIDGREMIVMNLYSEPNDRNDLSAGYHYVGDAQEGFACLDDTARAVVALAEHYRLYKDSASLKEIEGMLEFVLYMQESDGDFRNFIAKDSSGNYYKKDSASSYKDFSYWATRGYLALAYGYEALGGQNADLSQRVKAAMNLCADRIAEKIAPNYGTYNDGIPAWDLAGDNTVSANAIHALVKHNELFPGNTTVVQNIERLGEAVVAYAAGDWHTYPLGGIMHMSNRWDEWGSTQVSALALAGRVCDKEEWIDTAVIAADSFLTDLLISGRAYLINPTKQHYPELNYGTASYVDNFLTLYKVTGEVKYAQWAGIAATWWTGNNGSNAGTPMFNQEYGLAYDGIVSASQVSLNSGAESVVEAVRALARVLQNSEAKAVLYATKTDSVSAVTIEGEKIYENGVDVEYALAYSGLNDPNHAKVTKPNTDVGLDESVEQSAATVLPEAVRGTWAEVYSNWQGTNAFFCEGVGYNNVRLYKDGYLVTAVGVGGENQLQVGDYVKLDFMALVQFDTDLNAEVYAVDSTGKETLIADDSQMAYSPRTWYSGDNSVKTKAIAAIPEGTSHLKVQFSVTTTADAADYGKAYGTVTAARLFKMASPEIQSGGSAYSAGAYANMGAGTTKTFTQQIPATGAYDIYMSVGNAQTGTTVSFQNGQNTVSTELEKNESVQIVHIGRIELTEGEQSITIANQGQSNINFDALILYPQVTYANYRTTSGKTVTMERDSGEFVPKHTHNLTKVNEKKATCTDPGNIAYYTCECGSWFVDASATEEIVDKGSVVASALNHSWNNATCSSPKTCSRCNATEGAALGHDWQKATCDDPKTCSRCNATEGAALGHDWQDATCDDPKTCSRCNATEGAALGHDWQKATCDTPKTCSKCNATEGTALGHDWQDATCDTPKACSRCNATEGTTLDHDWQEATCDTPKTCSRCNATKGKALGHDWQKATCDTPKTCKLCGITDGEALGHNESKWKHDSKNHWKICKTCDNEIEGSKAPHKDADTNGKCDTCDYRYPQTPVTGDSSNLMLWGLLLAVSAVGLAALCGIQIKKRFAR